MTLLAEQIHLAASVFDTLAESYDARFTNSAIGLAQRQAVWRKAASVFSPGSRVLELNCGTGVDALFLASLGASVTACDASAGMIRQATLRKSREAPHAPVEFRQLSTEQIMELPAGLGFDGVFSNFSGLNCVADLSALAAILIGRLHRGAQLLLCLSTRFCLWEVARFLCRCDWRNAWRRCGGEAQATISGCELPVYYPTVRSLMRAFGPGFLLRSVTGIGIAVPPSYLESWAQEHRRVLRICEGLDRLWCSWPGARVIGDHVLLHLEKV